MKKQKIRTFFASIVFLFCQNIALHAQELSAIRGPESEIPNNTPFTIEVILTPGAAAPYCGLEVKWGDGVVENVRVEAPEDSIKLSHSYKSPGKYIVAVDGKLILRGLKSMLPCNGSARNLSLVVFDETAAAAASQREAELAAKEAELKRISAELDQQKRDAAIRENKLRQQELLQRQRDLEAREKALKQREQNAQQVRPASPPQQTQSNQSPTANAKTEAAVPPSARKPLEGF